MNWLKVFAAGVLVVSLGTAPTQAAEKLVIATEGAFPPYNFVAADGSLQGFDVDMANALCARIKAECEIIKQDWDGMIPGLLAKKYDVIVASMSIMPEREKIVDFTIPYYQAPTAMVAYKSAGVKVGADGYPDPESLKSKVIGVQRATGFETYVREHFKDAEIKVYDSSESANLDMAAGRLDARFDDFIVLQTGLFNSPIKDDVEQIGKIFPESMLGTKGEGIALRKGNEELKQKLNDAILAMRADGSYKAINDKYFTFDIYGQ